MRRSWGFTLLEVGIAFSVLVTALVGAWGFVFTAERHQRVLWDELVAGELAASALEEAFAEPSLTPTPSEGKLVTPWKGNGPEPLVLLPGLQMVLHLTPVPKEEALVDMRVSVTWQREGAGAVEVPCSIERTARRRIRR